MVIRAKKNSGDIVFPARCEDVDYEGILQRGSAVLHAATHRESVSCAQFETFPQAVHCQMPAHNVHNLIVWMAVHPRRPPPAPAPPREFSPPPFPDSRLPWEPSEPAAEVL